MKEREQGYIRPNREREPGCVFCEDLLEQTEGLVLDNGYWRVLVSRDQGYLGRCMVIPSRHIETEADLTETEVLEFHYLKVNLENAIERAFGARMFNWTELGNDAFAETEPLPHLHHHLRPRYQKPVEFAGRIFTDDAFGGMYDLNQRWNIDKDPEAGDLKDRIAETILLNL